MTYDARELSAETGAPVMLAVFALGEKVWRFVRGDQAVTFDGQLYNPTPGGIEPTRLRDSSEVRKNDVTLTVDRAFPIAELWRVSPPTAIVAVRLVEIHEGEPEGAAAWLGHVSNVSWVGEARAEITLSPGAMAMRANGLRRLWQRSCPHVLYGPKCRLSRVGEPVAAVLTAVDGGELAAAEFAGDFDLAGGRITWVELVPGEDPGPPEEVHHAARIQAHDGPAITLASGHPSLAVGTAVTVFPVLHQVEATLEAVDGLTLKAPQIANGMKFNGGFIEWTDAEGITDWRAIVAHGGDTVQMMNHAPRLEVGMTVTVVEGCARTLARCEELQNTDNYGGIPYFITKNPFSGDPIF